MQTESFDSKNSPDFINLSIPDLVTLSFPDLPWNIVCYQEMVTTFTDQGGRLDIKLQELLRGYLNISEEDFRIQLNYKTIPLLISIFNSDKTIRISSIRLNYELSVIRNLDDVQAKTDEDLGIYQNTRYIDFRSHVEKIISLNPQSFPSEIDLATKKFNLESPFTDQNFLDCKEKEHLLVQSLLKKINGYRPSLFEKMSDFSLGLTANFALLRIHLLKFIAILPSLDHDNKGHEVKRILLESLRRLLWDSMKAKVLKKKGQERTLPNWIIYSLRAFKFVANLCPAYPLAWFIRTSIRVMAKRFIAGETIQSATTVLKGLSSTGRDVTLDQLGELVVSEKEADHYCNEVVKLIHGFNLHVKRGDKNKAGILKAHVSIKVSALSSDFKPHAFNYTFDQVAPRLKKILLEAKKHDVFINIDAEHYDYRDLVFDIYKKVLLSTAELKDYQHTGIVVQAYLRDAAKHLNEVIELAKERELIMPIRLVKGAYWDAETVEAEAHAFNAPEFLNKEETDLHFRQLILKIYQAYPHLQLCIASHNYSDHAFAEALRTEKFPKLPEIEHQCLHMTYEALSTAMAKMGWAVRNYVPIGSLLVGMAYLVRRIMENSSQVGVLTIMRSHKKHRTLLSAQEIYQEKNDKGERVLDISQSNMTYNFFNITPVRLYLKDERERVQEALDHFNQRCLSQKYSNHFITSGEEVEIKSNSDLKLSVGKVQFANENDASRAIDTVSQAFNEGNWSKAQPGVRSSIILKAAQMMLVERLELASLIMYEAGKSIEEALGDVDEAIDFLNYYGKEEMKFHVLNPKAIARGPMAIIAPWNFPLAIPCGMTVAALVAGNTTILKSAEQTPLIACRLVDLLHRAGVPRDVLIHLPGLGETVGKTLVDSEKIAGVVFTGSKAVGTQIFQKVSQRIYTNELYKIRYPSKVITEMGGKNAILVTANAELDETVSGILYSSFAHAGQKCSAASRVLVDNSIKDRLIERLKEACTDLKVGKAFDFSTYVNPIVSVEDQDRLKTQAKEAIQEVLTYGGQVIVDRSGEELPGTCIGPVVLELPKSRLKDNSSFSRKELFGPVLHIIGFDHLDEGIELFNCTEYALTGGIFSQSQDDVDYATKKMLAGNIYVNRSITGARVAIEPFGGFKLSGTGPKAGGKGYLQSFHNIRFKENVFGGVKAPEEGLGEQHEIILAKPSLSITSVRGAKLELALEEFVEKFELFYQGIYLDGKEHLSKFHKWIGRHLVRFQTTEHPNRKIPGQISHNDFNQQIENACFICYERRPYLKTLLNVFSALGMGTGVTILVRNEETMNWWTHFEGLLHRAGFSDEEFKVYFCNKGQLAKTLKRPDIGIVFVDGQIDKVEQVSKLCFEGNTKVSVMKKIMTPHDSPSRNDFNRLCAEYAWVRSFAINTMRHGAPLDLSL